AGPRALPTVPEASAECGRARGGGTPLLSPTPPVRERHVLPLRECGLGAGRIPPTMRLDVVPGPPGPTRVQRVRRGSCAGRVSRSSRLLLRHRAGAGTPPARAPE